jgi:hypothetical protein
MGTRGGRCEVDFVGRETRVRAKRDKLAGVDHDAAAVGSLALDDRTLQRAAMLREVGSCAIELPRNRRRNFGQGDQLAVEVRLRSAGGGVDVSRYFSSRPVPFCTFDWS